MLYKFLYLSPKKCNLKVIFGPFQRLKTQVKITGMG